MALIKDGKVYRTFEEQMIYLTEDNSKIKNSIEDIRTDKQDKLVAGDNITIEDNVISASGGEVWANLDLIFINENSLHKAIVNSGMDLLGTIRITYDVGIIYENRTVFIKTGEIVSNRVNYSNKNTSMTIARDILYNDYLEYTGEIFIQNEKTVSFGYYLDLKNIPEIDRPKIIKIERLIK